MKYKKVKNKQIFRYGGGHAETKVYKYNSLLLAYVLSARQSHPLEPVMAGREEHESKQSCHVHMHTHPKWPTNLPVRPAPCDKGVLCLHFFRPPNNQEYLCIIAF
jgi:hypothetical protein